MTDQSLLNFIKLMSEKNISYQEFLFENSKKITIKIELDNSEPHSIRFFTKNPLHDGGYILIYHNNNISYWSDHHFNSTPIKSMIKTGYVNSSAFWEEIKINHPEFFEWAIWNII